MREGHLAQNGDHSAAAVVAAVTSSQLRLEYIQREIVGKGTWRESVLEGRREGAMTPPVIVRL